MSDCQYCGTEGCPSCLPNENCLYGMRCPKCQSNGPFDIVTTTLMMWSDDGTDWSKHSDGTEFAQGEKTFCRCYDCNHEATVADFRTEKWKQENPSDTYL